MIPNFEKDSVAETQDQVCAGLAVRIKDWMVAVESEELVRATITETMPPDPICATEHDLTVHYWLKPFTAHSGLSVEGATFMAMIYAYDGMNYGCEFSPLKIISVPTDKEGNYRLPEKFSEWQEVYEIDNYIGVLKPDRTRPDEIEITICRILLEDALSTIEPQAMAI